MAQRKEFKFGWMRGQEAVDFANKSGATLWHNGKRYFGPTGLLLSVSVDDLYVRAGAAKSERSVARRARHGR